MIIPIFIPHGGCPERCTFCDQKVSGGTPVALSLVEETLKNYESTFSAGQDSSLPGFADMEVAFYGGTFTALPQQLQLKYLEKVKPHPVRIATRPDSISLDWMRRLHQEFNVRVVELGVQSFSKSVLLALGRSHEVVQVKQSLSILRELGIKVGFHLMVGCPGEQAWEKERALLMENLVECRPDFVRVHPLLVLKGSALAIQAQASSNSMANDSETPWVLELEEALERCADLWEDLEALQLPVIRWGLQANELLGVSVEEGPYHPAFGDLVKGRVYRRRLNDDIEALVASSPVTSPQTILIEADSRAWSSLKGNQNCNISWLRRKIDVAFGPGVKIGYMLHPGGNKASLALSDAKVLNDLKHSHSKEDHGKRYHLSHSFQIRVLDPHGTAQCRKIKFI